MAINTRFHKSTFDANLEFADVDSPITDTASDEAQVGGSDKIVDADATGFTSGTMVFNITAIDVASSDENYKLWIQGSSSATFASDIQNLAVLVVGDSSTLGTQSADSTTGVYYVPFNNNVLGTGYRYLRVYVEIAGTSPSITYSAYAVPDR